MKGRSGLAFGDKPLAIPSAARNQKEMTPLVSRSLAQEHAVDVI